MRQVDPDVFPVYPITPQTPIIETFSKFVADGRAQRRARQRRVRALGDERGDRVGARGRTDDDRDVVAGARADGRGRLHRRGDARADRDGGRQPGALGADQHPLRPLRLDARPRLRLRAALRRGRAGGLRADACWRRGSRSAATSSCRCSSARTASTSRTRPSRCGLPDEAVREWVGEYHIPHALLLGEAMTQGPVLDARLLLRAQGRPGARARGGAAGLRRARGRARAR